MTTTPMTVAEAQAQLQASASAGMACPCCGQLVKVYRRALNSSMARSLIWLVRFYQSEPRWIDVPREAPLWLQRSRELPKLAYWGLVVAKPNTDDPTKRCTGQWAPTDAGVAFALGRTSQPSHVYLYNKGVRGFTDTPVTIRDALGTRFDYHELMYGSPASVSELDI